MKYKPKLSLQKVAALFISALAIATTIPASAMTFYGESGSDT